MSDTVDAPCPVCGSEVIVLAAVRHFLTVKCGTVEIRVDALSVPMEENHEPLQCSKCDATWKTLTEFVEEINEKRKEEG